MGCNEYSIRKFTPKTRGRNSEKGYDHIRAKIDDQELIDHQPVQLMRRVLKMPKSTYYQSFHKQPNSYHVANEKLLVRIMKHAGIRSNITKKYKPTSSSSSVEKRENVLEQDLTTEAINEKWVGDITYIHTIQDGWCYLASVQDLHTKKIVGYKFEFGRRMAVDLALDALENAVHAQNPVPGLICIPI